MILHWCIQCLASVLYIHVVRAFTASRWPVLLEFTGIIVISILCLSAAVEAILHLNSHSSVLIDASFGDLLHYHKLEHTKTRAFAIAATSFGSAQAVLSIFIKASVNSEQFRAHSGWVQHAASNTHRRNTLYFPLLGTELTLHVSAIAWIGTVTFAIISGFTGLWALDSLAALATVCMPLPSFARRLAPRSIILSAMHWLSSLLALPIDTSVDMPAFLHFQVWLMVPILRDLCAKTLPVLLQMAPAGPRAAFDLAIREVRFFDGVLDCSEEHFWVSSGGSSVGSCHVKARPLHTKYPKPQNRRPQPSNKPCARFSTSVPHIPFSPSLKFSNFNPQPRRFASGSARPVHSPRNKP